MIGLVILTTLLPPLPAVITYPYIHDWSVACNDSGNLPLLRTIMTLWDVVCFSPYALLLLAVMLRLRRYSKGNLYTNS
jgi:hypothetical protein